MSRFLFQSVIQFILIPFIVASAASSGDSKHDDKKSEVTASRGFRSLYELDPYPYHGTSNIISSRVTGVQGLGGVLPELVMYGLAGIPIFKAIKYFSPMLIGNRGLTTNKKPGKDMKKHRRPKRDLAYANELLDILIDAETILEKYGVTEPQCQLRATCEIHRRGVNGIATKSELKFIKLVSEMRREIQNPRVVPMAKYVFEYYEEAAVRGEDQCDCGQVYNRCPTSIEYLMKRKKGKPRVPKKYHY